MRAPWSYIPAVPIAVGIMAGIVVSVLMPICAAVAVSVALVSACAYFWHKRRWYFVMVVLAALVGMLVAGISRPAEAPEFLLDGHLRAYRGVVEKVVVADVSQRCVVGVDAFAPVPESREMLTLPRKFRCKLVLTDIYPIVAVGDSLVFRTALRPVPAYGDMPFLAAPFGANIAEKTVAVAPVEPDGCLVGGNGGGIMAFADSLRRSAIDMINSSPLSPGAASLLVGAAFGDSSQLDQDTLDAFRASGLGHLLCVSGFHVGIVAAVFAFLLFPMRLWSRRGRYRHIITILFVWAYALVVGLTPSVVRASCMITILLFSRLLSRRVSPFNTLAIAVIVICTIDPYSVFSIGFQLSVAAVLGLLVFFRKLNPVPEHLLRLRSAIGLLVVPLSAMLGIFPLLIVIFHRVPLLFIPANVVASLLFPVFVPLGFGLVLLHHAGIGFAPGMDFCDSMAEVLGRLASLADSQIAGLYLPGQSLFFIIVSVVMLALVLHLETRDHKLAAAVVGGICVVATACNGLEKAITPSAYLVSDRGRMEFVVTSGEPPQTVVFAASGIPREDPRAEAERVGRSLRSFLEAAGCDSVEYVQNDFVRPGVMRSGFQILVGASEFVILNGMWPDSVVVSYARPGCGVVLCRGYKGDYDYIVRNLHPEHVYIAEDVSPEMRVNVLEISESMDVVATDMRRVRSVRIFPQP